MCNAAGLSTKGRTSAAAELDVFFLAFIASSHALMASSTDGSTSRGPPGQFMSADLFASGFPDTRLGSETEPKVQVSSSVHLHVSTIFLRGA